MNECSSPVVGFTLFKILGYLDLCFLKELKRTFKNGKERKNFLISLLN